MNMLKNTYPGKFIVLEGPDGSGQSTQVNLLSKYLEKILRLEKKAHRAKYTGVFITKEPSTGFIGGFVREALKERWKRGSIFGPMLMQALFVADRAHHLEYEIIPALEKGMVVICDRYALSTIAYGAAEHPGLWSCLIAMNDTFLEPDLIFILDVPGKVCVKRITETRGHAELYEKAQMLDKVLVNFKKVAKRFPRTFVIDGQKPKRQVFDEIRVLVDKNLGYLQK